MKFTKYKSQRLLRIASLLITISLSIQSRGTAQTDIRILMPAPFVDSTKELVDQYNSENKGKVKINVTRGPRETESVSDLAISSLLLQESPYDIILIDITWLPKYVKANWLTPLDGLINKNKWEVYNVTTSTRRSSIF